MRVEFFVSEWLDEHPATFAISHMIVLGLIYGALLAMGIEARGGDSTLAKLYGEPVVIGILLAATSIGIGFECGEHSVAFALAAIAADMSRPAA